MRSILPFLLLLRISQQANLVLQSANVDCSLADYFVIDNDCHAYWQCFGIQVVKMTCGGNLMFNPQTETCDWPRNVMSQRSDCTLKKAEEQPLDCRWYESGKWSPCSVSCGQGVQTRRRKISQHPRNGGKPCKSKDSRITRPCRKPACPKIQDCKWSPWSDWSECSGNCGNGVQSRTRSIEVKALNGGLACQGLPTETRQCSTGIQCPKDCQWSGFGEWSKCSAECNGGVQSRSRTIKNKAENGGKLCSGLDIEERSCNEHIACAVDCAWTEFDEWSKCTKSCGAGKQFRSRTIANKAEHGGKGCVGPASESRSCNIMPCPEDCKWTDFGEWTTCSKSCGNGVQSRSRSIENEAKHGGQSCIGSMTETRSCSLEPCPQDCKWSEFGEWTTCSKSCGSGEQSRTRSMENEAKNGGKSCIGSQTETRSCNDQPCELTKVTDIDVFGQGAYWTLVGYDAQEQVVGHVSIDNLESASTLISHFQEEIDKKGFFLTEKQIADICNVDDIPTC